MAKQLSSFQYRAQQRHFEEILEIFKAEQAENRTSRNLRGVYQEPQAMASEETL
jgi:hypothetical protein